MTKTKANFLILLAALIFGSYFIVLKVVSEMGFSPAAILLLRGGLFLVTAIVFLRRGIFSFTKREVLIGSLIGILNFGAYYLQTLGGKYTTPSNNAFLTCLNTLFVPLFAFLIYKKKPSKKLFISLPAAIVGLALIAGFFSSSLQMGIGDIYSILCAVVFAIVILLLGNEGQSIPLGKVLFFMAVWMTLGGLLLFGVQDGFVFPAANWAIAAPTFVYLGVVCMFGATAIQAYGQRFTSETATVMILSVESVFALVISVIAGYDKLSLSLSGGGALIIAAVLFLLCDFRKKKKVPQDDDIPDEKMEVPQNNEA